MLPSRPTQFNPRASLARPLVSRLASWRPPSLSIGAQLISRVAQRASRLARISSLGPLGHQRFLIGLPGLAFVFRRRPAAAEAPGDESYWQPRRSLPERDRPPQPRGDLPVPTSATDQPTATGPSDQITPEATASELAAPLLARQALGWTQLLHSTGSLAPPLMFDPIAAFAQPLVPPTTDRPGPSPAQPIGRLAQLPSQVVAALPPPAILIGRPPLLLARSIGVALAGGRATEPTISEPRQSTQATEAHDPHTDSETVTPPAPATGSAPPIGVALPEAPWPLLTRLQLASPSLLADPAPEAPGRHWHHRAGPASPSRSLARPTAATAAMLSARARHQVSLAAPAVESEAVPADESIFPGAAPPPVAMPLTPPVLPPAVPTGETAPAAWTTEWPTSVGATTTDESHANQAPFQWQPSFRPSRAPAADADDDSGDLPSMAEREPGPTIPPPSSLTFISAQRQSARSGRFRPLINPSAPLRLPHTPVSLLFDDRPETTSASAPLTEQPSAAGPARTSRPLSMLRTGLLAAPISLPLIELARGAADAQQSDRPLAPAATTGLAASVASPGARGQSLGRAPDWPESDTGTAHHPLERGERAARLSPVEQAAAMAVPNDHEIGNHVPGARDASPPAALEMASLAMIVARRPLTVRPALSVGAGALFPFSAPADQSAPSSGAPAVDPAMIGQPRSTGEPFRRSAPFLSPSYRPFTSRTSETMTTAGHGGTASETMTPWPAVALASEGMTGGGAADDQRGAPVPLTATDRRLAAINRATASHGRALPLSIRAPFEHLFRTSFADVEVHTDPAAAEAASTVGAAAMTLGERIFFAAGQFQPQEPTGSALLAHELTHVIQQRRGPMQIALKSLATVMPAEQSPGESEAEQSEAEVLELHRRGNFPAQELPLARTPAVGAAGPTAQASSFPGLASADRLGVSGFPVLSSFTVQRANEAAPTATGTAAAQGSDGTATNQLGDAANSLIPGDAPGGGLPASQVDLIADRVYSLLKEKLTVERERRGRWL